MLRATQDGVSLAVRAQPGAKRTAITGLYGDGPALTAFLAATFSIPKSAVQLTSGQLSRSKVFHLRGLTLSEANAVLARHIA
jgi:uncharacterized protein YggU (UPF0235/DUF167 family)